MIEGIHTDIESVSTKEKRNQSSPFNNNKTHKKKVNVISKKNIKNLKQRLHDMHTRIDKSNKNS